VLWNWNIPDCSDSPHLIAYRSEIYREDIMSDIKILALGSSVWSVRLITLLLVWTLITGQSIGMAAGTYPVKSTPTTTTLNEDQRILHLLNRLGFGARPGDIERVKKIGLDRYIDQQLHPNKIDDSLVETKLKGLESLSLSTSELYARYPSPNILMKELERRGALPEELAELRQNREKGNKNLAEMAASDANGSTDMVEKKRNNEYRRALADYYAANNLLLPQRLTFELQASRILRAVYSERQLQEVMVDFWTNHFNIFIGKNAEKWLLIPYDRDVIRPNTMSNFYDLLLATAKSPAMLYYLDNYQSVSPNMNRRDGMNQRRFPRAMGRMSGINRDPIDRELRMRNRINRSMVMQDRREMARPQAARPEMVQQKRKQRGINENYARELMELHTLGVDGGYTQKDVQEVARCFTGWTINNPRGRMTKEMSNGMDRETGEFFFNPRLHDDGEKIVLGHKIPAGGGMKDGLKVLEILVNHPSTAKFIATKLSRRFVMDEPTPQLVDRVASAFTKSRGDIRETLRAIFSSPEFNSSAAYRAKIKTPFEFAVSSIRALGGETNSGPQLIQWISRMGEPLYQYQAPTGYPDLAEAWVNTGGLLERLNFSLALASNSIAGTRINLLGLTGNQTNSKDQVMNILIQNILHGEISDKTKATLFKEWNSTSEPQVIESISDNRMENRENYPRKVGRGRKARVNAPASIRPEMKLAGLILGSPEFQRQ
jgi:uncharacterized protein (DUF1800 family)